MARPQSPAAAASTANGHRKSGETKSHSAGTAAMPNEHRTSIGRAPSLSTARPQSGAVAIRTTATATPCTATSVNPSPRLLSMWYEKKLAESATAAFQQSR